MISFGNWKVVFWIVCGVVLLVGNGKGVVVYDMVIVYLFKYLLCYISMLWDGF